MRAKVVPLIKTLGTEKYKKFLETPFHVNMLNEVIKYENIPLLFSDWHGKDMGKWYKIFLVGDVTLEFYANDYTIKKDMSKLRLGVFQLPFPKTVNDFINDMERFGVDLYWTDWMDENFEPKDYLSEDKIKEYFVELLGKMDKSYEIT